MTKDYSPDRLDVKAFVQAGAHLKGHDSLLKYERLVQEAHGIHPDLHVDWQVQGELRAAEGPAPEAWMHLTVQATQPLLCQRCLTPVDVPLEVDRWFRFVADEATAEALDDDAEEDLLAISREFDLHALIEDELLMALPVVARHEECPVVVPMVSSSEDFDAAEAEKPNPFAALTGFKGDKSGS
ncbi:YceD family protein [Simplicispira psychrophila]|uniref:YceD family protein n=1 Tax=Simplicispira psychrophila TaxID=80882 RepID=UPI00048400C6|nr:YceD family protein [Simplicispira psychrophila]